RIPGWPDRGAALQGREPAVEELRQGLPAAGRIRAREQAAGAGVERASALRQSRWPPRGDLAQGHPRPLPPRVTSTSLRSGVAGLHGEVPGPHEGHAYAGEEDVSQRGRERYGPRDAARPCWDRRLVELFPGGQEWRAAKRQGEGRGEETGGDGAQRGAWTGGA